MTWIDLFALAALNLWRRRLRAVLTVSGVVIGTACIIVMVALGLGNMEQFNSLFLKNVDLTQIQVQSDMGGKGRSNGQGLTEANLAAMRQIPDVSIVSPMLYVPLHVSVGRYEADLQALAVDPALLSEIEFDKGGLFTSAAVPEIILGGNLLPQFHKKGDTQWMNEKEPKAPDIDWLSASVEITLGMQQGIETSASADTPISHRYMGRICGYTKPEQMSEQSYQTYIDIAIAKKMIQENRVLAQSLGLEMNSYGSASILAKDLNSVKPVLDQLKNMGYQAYSVAESLESIKQEQQRQQGQLLLIAVISLFVSAIGIANTMLTSITERRSEIGVMKVIGLAIGKINMLFLTESAIIGLVGGILGSLIGFVVQWAINAQSGETTLFGMYFAQGAKLLIPFWLPLAAVFISMAVGVLSGVYPAYKATKMSPLEAIRSGG